MKNTKFLTKVFLLLIVFCLGSTARAQTRPEGVLNIVNNTYATLTIQIKHLRGRREYVEVEIPPITERRVILRAGYVWFTAIAARSSPVKSFSKEFPVYMGRAREMNVFARDFGMHMLVDKPSTGGTGLTINQSKTAQNSLDSALKRLDPTRKEAWSHGGCAYDYNRYLKTRDGVSKENGGFYPNTVFVVGYNAGTTKLYCEIRRFTPVSAAEDSALKSCQRYLGEKYAATCRTLIKLN